MTISLPKLSVARPAALALTLMLFFGAVPAAATGDLVNHGDLARGIEAFQERDFARALRWLEPAAARGEAQALFILGFMHQNGQGVPADPEKGADLLREAAFKGYRYAQYSLGASYRFAIGVERDLVLAHHWLLLSELNGYDPARQMREVIELDMQPAQIARSRDEAFASPAHPHGAILANRN
jgi:TPR repeat protein